VRLYRRTAQFPGNERFELVSQIRRSASSIGANIAEGCGRGGDGELGFFLKVAKGSSSELENHLLLARDLGYLSDEEFVDFEISLREVGRMLAAFGNPVAIAKRAVSSRK
jgi:four helix bundle protein